MKRIAVLLTVFNRRVKTIACLKALYGQTLPEGYSLDVFLTDDGCTDGTSEAIRSEFPQVHIIHGDGTLYWNRGMYAAWSEAEKGDYDFYLWLNDDTDLLPGAMNALIFTAERDNSAIVVGSCHASEVPNRITYGARGKNMTLILPTETAKTKAVTFNGNIVLIPKKVYNKLGMLDKRYRHSLGDFDYGLRASEAGIPIVVVDEFCGICDTHPTMSKWADSSKSLSERWKHFWSPTGANPFEYFMFRKRHHGFIPACITLCTNFIHVLIPQLWNSSPR